MDKDNEIIKLRENYQYLEEYLQQEISKQDSLKNIEILNEMIRRKSDEISNLQIALGVSIAELDTQINGQKYQGRNFGKVFPS
uniref:Uncharacterized protein n=1 Tax=Quercus lobata TaxID=97700 RepID=A0A7N2KKF1_QUELO